MPQQQGLTAEQLDALVAKEQGGGAANGPSQAVLDAARGQEAEYQRRFGAPQESAGGGSMYPFHEGQPGLMGGFIPPNYLARAVTGKPMATLRDESTQPGHTMSGVNADTANFISGMTSPVGIGTAALGGAAAAGLPGAAAASGVAGLGFMGVGATQLGPHREGEDLPATVQRNLQGGSMIAGGAAAAGADDVLGYKAEEQKIAARRAAIPPVKEYNAAVKPQGAGVAEEDLAPFGLDKPQGAGVGSEEAWKLFGPQLKEVERLKSPNRSFADSEHPYGTLAAAASEALDGENNPMSIQAQTDQAFAPVATAPLTTARSARVATAIAKAIPKFSDTDFPGLRAQAGDRISSYVRGQLSNLTMGDALARVHDLNQELAGLYNAQSKGTVAGIGDQMTTARPMIAIKEAEVNALRNELYDQATVYGIAQAPLMKEVYGAGSQIRDAFLKAHEKQVREGEPPSLFEHSIRNGGLAALASAALTHSPEAAAGAGVAGALVSPVVEGVARANSPMAKFAKAWERYDPTSPVPFQAAQVPVQVYPPNAGMLGPGATPMGPANVPTGTQPGFGSSAQNFPFRQLPPGPAGNASGVTAGLNGAIVMGPAAGSGGVASGQASLSGPIMNSEPGFPGNSASRPALQPTQVLPPSPVHPIAPRGPVPESALPELEKMPSSALHSMLTSKEFGGFEGLQAMRSYLDKMGQSSDFPRIRAAVDGIIRNWDASKQQQF